VSTWVRPAFFDRDNDNDDDDDAAIIDENDRFSDRLRGEIDAFQLAFDRFQTIHPVWLSCV
jgi:hypothetical protein